MYESTVNSISDTSVSKVSFMKKNPFGFFLSSILAGVFISFGSFVSISVLGYTSYLGTISKILSSFAFSSALSLVIMCGCELFTGNNMTIGFGVVTKKVTVLNCLNLWLFCWFGNLLGSLLSIYIFHYTGSDIINSVIHSFNSVSGSKCSKSIIQLISCGILCNTLVCLAVWCSFKLKEEISKLIMIFWCIFIFMICGFEHSIANMSILGVSLINGGISIIDYIYNLSLVTLGNIIGGFLFVSIPYFVISNKNNS